MANNKLEYERLVRGLAKGAGVVLIGSFLGRIFGYLIRIFIARIYGQEIYGYISTSYALFTIVTTIGLLGIPSSLPRQISYYLGKNNWNNIRSNIGMAFLFIGVVGFILGFVLSIFAKTIANNIFDNPNLISYIIYFGLGIPLFLFLRVGANVFQGFRQMTTFIIFRHILQRVLILVFLILLFFIQISEKHLALAYLLSYFFCMIAVIFSLYKSSPLRDHKITFDYSSGKTLFKFSWPLMFSSIIMLLMQQTDTLMVGYFLNQTQVGIYNAGVPIAQLLSLIYVSFTPLLIPLMTEYFAKKQSNKLEHTFALSTKWIFLFTFPLYLLIMIYPHFFIEVIFGTEYINAVNVLRFIATGLFFSAMVGPTGNLLIVIGKPNFVLLDSSIAYIANVILNIILIQKYGILGAAFATAISLIIHNSITIAQIYYFLRLSPFGQIYLRITLAGIIPAIILWLFFKSYNNLYILFYCLGFIILFLILIYTFNVLKEDDKIILREIRKRIS